LANETGERIFEIERFLDSSPERATSKKHKNKNAVPLVLSTKQLSVGQTPGSKPQLSLEVTAALYLKPILGLINKVKRHLVTYIKNKIKKEEAKTNWTFPKTKAARQKEFISKR
jgi:hypothetical protein